MKFGQYEKLFWANGAKFWWLSDLSVHCLLNCWPLNGCGSQNCQKLHTLLTVNST